MEVGGVSGRRQERRPALESDCAEPTGCGVRNENRGSITPCRTALGAQAAERPDDRAEGGVDTRLARECSPMGILFARLRPVVRRLRIREHEPDAERGNTSPPDACHLHHFLE